MALIIQAFTLSGRILEGARWVINGNSFFSVTQKINVELPVKDSQLLTFLSKNPRNECVIDKAEKDENDKGKAAYSAVLTCTITDVRHMVSIASSTVDTMVVIAPANRWVEHIMQYILNPNRSNPQFLMAVRGDPRIPGVGKVET